MLANSLWRWTNRFLRSPGLQRTQPFRPDERFRNSFSLFLLVLADVKALLRATNKVAVVNVNGLSQVHTQVLKCGELEFASNAVLEFAALDFHWIALYADVIKLTGAATVRRTDSINIDGAPGVDGSDAPPTPPGYGTNGLNGKAGGPWFGVTLKVMPCTR